MTFVAPSVGIVCFRGADVLLVKRGQAPLAGAWSLPGGRIEPGETAEDAARRELLEETAIEAKLMGLVDVVDAIFRSRRTGQTARHYLLIDYAAKWMAGEPIAGDDAAEARFFAPAELPSLGLWEETQRVIDLARGLS
ncbi:MAG: NUDIX hydrolase [Pseudomonadota bacterium]